MGKPHYLVQRSRLGRFNFTFITPTGQFKGFIHIPTAGKTGVELKREAHDRIRALAKEFASANGVDDIID